MKRFLWKVNRLRAMGIGEIGYRFRHAVNTQLEKRGVGLAHPGTPQGKCGNQWVEELPVQVDVSRYRFTADQVLVGQFNVLGLRNARLGFPPVWNRDPKTRTVAPLHFGKTLDYRETRIVGEIKYLWEPNRHAELVLLAQAWRLTREAPYLLGCVSLLESWFVQCPYPLGANWSSGLEVAVRLTNWAVAWHMLGEENLDAAFKQRWLDSVYQHCYFIFGNFSRYSSANNHLLGELMGLFIGATVWPLWEESANWRASAAREFEVEALRQNGEDGVNREQAIWYQHEVADMMWLVGLFGSANGVTFSTSYWHRLERMLEFICAVMDSRGRVPMLGDADDARLVRFDPGADVEVYRSLLATGAVFFRRTDFARKARRFDDKSRWLLGDSAALQFASMFDAQSHIESVNAAEAQVLPQQEFRVGGYYVLGSDFDTEREVHMVADAGPLGYLSIAAHGHADALAFTLSVAGEEILVDPGTYTYRTQDKWRSYFRGTSAHNTIRVDQEDQSVIGGGFLWTRHARAWCKVWSRTPEEDYFIGEHDGYHRLADPVTHCREIFFNKRTRCIDITDSLDCGDSHQIEVYWHFSEGCEVSVVPLGVRVLRGKVALNIKMEGMSGAVDVVRGSEDPPLGWISRRFDCKVPSPTVRWAGTIAGASKLLTTIRLQGD